MDKELFSAHGAEGTSAEGLCREYTIVPTGCFPIMKGGTAA